MALYIAFGSYIGDGTDNRAITGLGFTPKVVAIKQAGAEPGVWRTDQMPADTSKTSASTSFVADRIQSLDSDGFTIGADADVNESGEYHVWVAYGGSDVQTGTYVGTTPTPLSITGLGSNVAFVGTFRDGALAFPVLTNATTSPGDLFGQGAASAAAFYMISDGFEVAGSITVNNNGSTYYWFAINEVAGIFKAVAYAGTGAIGTVTGFGFDPEAVLVKRFASTSGQFKTPIFADTVYSNTVGVASSIQVDITDFITDGVAVTAAAAVNAAGSNYWSLGMTRNHPAGNNDGGTGIARGGAITPVHLTSSGTTLGLTVPSGGVPQDATLLLAVSFDHTTTVLSAADTRGNTYVVDVVHATGTSRRAAILRSTITTALQAGDTITLTSSGAIANMVLGAVWFTGIKLTSPLIASASATGNTTRPSVSAQPTGPNQLVIGTFGHTGNTALQVGHDGDSFDGPWQREWTYDPLYFNSVNLISHLHWKVVASGTPLQRLTPFTSTTASWAGAMAVYDIEPEAAIEVAARFELAIDVRSDADAIKSLASRFELGLDLRTDLDVVPIIELAARFVLATDLRVDPDAIKSLGSRFVLAVGLRPEITIGMAEIELATRFVLALGVEPDIEMIHELAARFELAVDLRAQPQIVRELAARFILALDLRGDAGVIPIVEAAARFVLGLDLRSSTSISGAPLVRFVFALDTRLAAIRYFAVLGARFELAIQARPDLQVTRAMAARFLFGAYINIVETGPNTGLVVTPNSREERRNLARQRILAGDSTRVLIARAGQSGATGLARAMSRNDADTNAIPDFEMYLIEDRDVSQIPGLAATGQTARITPPESLARVLQRRGS